jgi:hypothetical protein
MTQLNSVGPSRDGDQFHYLWAARRCLRLLAAGGDLVAVSIEAASPREEVGLDKTEDVIDIGEYYGNENVKAASRVRYLQLKHSTLHANDAWTASGLEKTIKGFAERFTLLGATLSDAERAAKVEFAFVTNRPLATAVTNAIADAASGATQRQPDVAHLLQRYSALNDADFASFCALFKLVGGEDGLWGQRNILFQELSGYLPDNDVDAPVQLKELLTKKALSQGAENPTITRLDVLRALRVDEHDLAPAPPRMEVLQDVVVRDQHRDLVTAIAGAAGRPVIVHAEGGVGKSIFATQIGALLPAGSLAVVYDCFGNGRYRTPTQYRHRHKDGLVQMANEIAGRALCHPLIPTVHADAGGYIRSFMHRLRQAVQLLRAHEPNALLCVVVDAADNAQSAAEDIGESRSFAKDLLKEDWPEGVRFVALGRSHRIARLDPPPNALQLELKPFTLDETAAHLRTRYAQATVADALEFHRLTSQNPRVQAIAMGWGDDIGEMLRKLGPNPTNVEDTIKALLDDAIAGLKVDQGGVEAAQIDRICAALSVLRPLVPIHVIAKLAGVDASAVRSFALDLGRPLLVLEDSLQFLDEPAETWFRERFKPDGDALRAFIGMLKPLARESAYVAAALPQLMLEAGEFDQLVTLALSSQALPDASPIESRDIELERLQFAFKASLRAERWSDAAKLAVKAGGESAGDERRSKLLQSNTDLAAVFLDVGGIQDIVSRGVFGSGWVGSHNSFEAGVMATHSALQGDARSRLRMAYEWIRNLARLDKEDRKREDISDEDIAELAWAELNIHGPRICARNLRLWTPREVSFRSGRLLARRLADHQRYADMNALAVEAGNDIGLVLAIGQELRQVHRVLPDAVVVRALRLLTRLKCDVDPHHRNWDLDETRLQAVTALVEAGVKIRAAPGSLITLLTRYLPDTPTRALSSRFSRARFPLLKAYALKAVLNGEALQEIDLAHPELKTVLLKDKHSHGEDAATFMATVGALLPWHLLCARALTGVVDRAALASEIEACESAATKAQRYAYREGSDTPDEIARLWLATEAEIGAPDLERLAAWIEKRPRPLTTSTLTTLSRVSARLTGQGAFAIAQAARSHAIAKDEREDAEIKVDANVDLARAMLAAGKAESESYFNEAIEVAARIGDENVDRWLATLDLADRAADRSRPRAKAAYRFSRAAELTYHHVARDKHFPWTSTIEALVGLSPASSLAIVSRWRDRGVGRFGRQLLPCLESLVEQGQIPAATALDFIWLHGGWDALDLLDRALGETKAGRLRDVLVDNVVRTLSLVGPSPESRARLTILAAKHGIAIDVPPLRVGATSEKGSPSDDASASPAKDWNAVFKGINVGDANDLARAYERWRGGEAPFEWRQFLSECMTRAAGGKEAAFIAALPLIPGFDTYTWREWMEVIPAVWRDRLATKSALAQTFRGLCRRYCYDLSKSRIYQLVPIDLLSRYVSERDIVREVTSALAESVPHLSAGRLFTIVGLLSMELSTEEAAGVLDFVLDQFEPLLRDTDGEGPWRDDLDPGTNIDLSVAGNLWSALGSPWGDVRWGAAHVVRSLARSGNHAVLTPLVQHARAQSGGAFAASAFHFYHHDATLWLLIALARAATESPSAVARYSDYVRECVETGEPHVLKRHFARAALSALVTTEEVKVDRALDALLAGVNQSSFPKRPAPKPGEWDAEDTEGEDADDGGGASRRGGQYFLGLDFGQYWLAPLGRAFRRSEGWMEKAVHDLIVQEWAAPEALDYQGDARALDGQFRDTSGSRRGDYPDASDLRFYFAFHATMIVAGRLLATRPLTEDEDDDYYSFDSWLARHALARDDGRWVADRRDPRPTPRPELSEPNSDRDWIAGITRRDFDDVLRVGSDEIVVWGDWNWGDHRRRLSLSVRSAFVAPDRAPALLRALQTAQNPHDYVLPAAGDRQDISAYGYAFKGWIAHRNEREDGLDELDDWSADLRWPPSAFAPYVIDGLGLMTDADRRFWTRDGKVVARSEMWGDPKDPRENDPDERGSRLVASLDLINEARKTCGVDLLIEVEIERRMSSYRYEREESDGLEYRYPSTRLFLIRGDGEITSL